MSDNELISYCVTQCRTEVGAISGTMMARLNDLAGGLPGESAALLMDLQEDGNA